MSTLPRTKITTHDRAFQTINSTYTSAWDSNVKGQMELPFKGTLTLEDVRAVIDEARESIIQTICDAVERMIEDANNR